MTVTDWEYKKADKNRTVNYHYDGKGNLTGLTYGENTIYFYYNSDGEVTSMSFDNSMYYYIKNLQGDVVKIVDQGGTTVVTYTYDSFGKIVDSTDTTTFSIGSINPFRYRGYVYDSETGLYYLKSRYYDPKTGRFINADVYCDTMSSIFGTNMFTYCNNNSVNQVDPEGTDAYWLQFEDAVRTGFKHAVYYDRYGVLVVEEIPEIVFGHTSLLLQDSVNNWWYFYWGPKQAMLRPCGKDNFSLSELNSYLTGFDPRPHHNYYVYATNVMPESQDINYSNGSNYYLKLFDFSATHMFKFKGRFNDSYEYAKDILEWLKIKSNATQLCQTIYENGVKYTMYHVCVKSEGDTTSGYYYKDIKLKEGYENNAPGIKRLIYDFSSNNCAQVSTEILHKGTFSENYDKYRRRIESLIGSVGGKWPNNAFDFVRFG